MLYGVCDVVSLCFYVCVTLCCTVCEMLYHCTVMCVRCHIAVMYSECDVVSLYYTVCEMLYYCDVLYVRCCITVLYSVLRDCLPSRWFSTQSGIYR